MYHSSVFAFPFLMAIAQAMTLPSPGSSALAARDNIGVKVGFSDDTFEWGTTNPVDVVNMLYQECYDSGICNPEGYTANTNLPMNAGGNQILAAEILSVTFHNADYAIWVKNGMVAALATAVEQVMTSKVVVMENCRTTKRTQSSGGGSTHCTQSKATVYTAPASLMVTWPDASDPNAPVSAITISVALQTPPSPLSGLCSAIAGAGSIVAGKVKDAELEMGFDLLDLICPL